MMAFRDVLAKTLAQAQPPVEKSVTLELNKIRGLTGIDRGVRCMGLVESKRPVVLIVEDEFLLRMDAVDMIAAPGSRWSKRQMPMTRIEILESVRTSRWCLPYPDAGLHGRIEACPGRQGSLAADQDLSQPPATSMSRKPICLKAGGFCRNPTVRDRSQVCCES